MITKGQVKLGIYLADISSAFDKVSRTLLLAKLAQLGVAESFLDFLNSYLLSREGYVAVEGVLSECMMLTDIVYQGTVLGPSLWNAFFGDIATYVPEDGQHCQIFADDLKVDASCPEAMSNDVLKASLGEAQHRAHEWGERNRVTFDPTKESIRIIHPTQGDAEEFVLLGTLFDCQLTMSPCIDSLLKTLRPKVRAILKLKHVLSMPSLKNQYKAHVWSKVEYHNGAFFSSISHHCMKWSQHSGKTCNIHASLTPVCRFASQHSMSQINIFISNPSPDKVLYHNRVLYHNEATCYNLLLFQFTRLGTPSPEFKEQGLYTL